MNQPKNLTIDPAAVALLKDALAPGETPLWADRPRAWSYIAPPRAVIGLSLLMAAFDSFYVAGAFGPATAPGLWQGLLLRLFALHTVPVVLLLLWPLWRWLGWRRSAYALTAHRALLRQGLLGAVASIPLDQVDSVELNVQGGAFGVGHVTLRLAKPTQDQSFWSVNDAYHVSQLARFGSSPRRHDPEGKLTA